MVTTAADGCGRVTAGRITIILRWLAEAAPLGAVTQPLLGNTNSIEHPETASKLQRSKT
ncbi:MAG TPA: hypothetical protein VGQ39_13305 [Pyrinomonadaceae bacterium]|nr:hypothetical protein [Pyrinomonadaceae bacterium]